MSRHVMKGPHGGMRGGAKAKDFKGSLKKLVKYMSVYKVQMLFVAVFAVCGTVFNIVGPKILGKATTEIFNGLVSKVSGGSGMDFGKIGHTYAQLRNLTHVFAWFFFSLKIYSCRFFLFFFRRDNSLNFINHTLNIRR